MGPLEYLWLFFRPFIILSQVIDKIKRDVEKLFAYVNLADIPTKINNKTMKRDREHFSKFSFSFSVAFVFVRFFDLFL